MERIGNRAKMARWVFVSAIPQFRYSRATRNGEAAKGRAWLQR